MTPERYHRICQVLARRQPDLTVITDEVHKGRNLSAITRTCDAVGVDRIHCAMPESGYQTFSGTSASAEKWVEVNHYSLVSEPVEQLQARGFQIVAANLGPTTVDFRAVDYTRPTALLLGAEVKGVSEFSATAADINISVPMVGMVESFNVSVACAIILMEAQRQRQQAGMYDQQRLSDERYRQLFFKWAHPTLATYCEENRLPFPPVREDGEVENLSEWYQSTRDL